MVAHWRGQRFARHFHDTYTIGVNEHGRGAFECRRAERDALPGTLNLIEPGEVHTGRSTAREGWAYRNFYIDMKAMTVLMEMAGCPRLASFSTASAVDLQTARALATTFDILTDPATTLLERESHLVLVIRLLSRRHMTSPVIADTRAVAQDRIVAQQLQAYLEAHSDRHVALSELAQLAQRSAFAVIRVFQRQTGLPPHAYHNTLRINRAKRMLRAGRPIAETATACGFYDQSYMYRPFRRMTGLPPGRYQASAISSKTLN